MGRGGGEGYVDWLTGRQVAVPDPERVRLHLQELLAQYVRHGRDRASSLARFWTDVYPRLIYPLHWGWDETGAARPREELVVTGPLRARPGAPGYPPLLLDEEGTVAAWAAVDDALCVLLGPALDEADRQARREAALARPLAPNGTKRGGSTLPAGWENVPVAIAVVGAERVQRYLFAGPGLPEMRGASRLLEAATREAKARIGREVGPEAVIRAAASTVVFAAPEERVEELIQLCRRIFHAYTAGRVQVTAGWASCRLGDLRERYGSAVRTAWLRRARERDEPDAGEASILPFEERCAHCRELPAAIRVVRPEGDALYCRPCARAREEGLRSEAAALVVPYRQALGLKPPADIREMLAGQTDGDTRGARLALGWGDGNNFGQLGQLDALGKAREWTARLAVSAPAAIESALVGATQAAGRQVLPFEILVAGGDDIGFLAEGSTALRAAEGFLHLTDLEFGSGSREAHRAIGFSLGLVAAPEMAPVRELREVAEEVLLRWAKEEFRQAPEGGGRVALWVATSVEQIPIDQPWEEAKKRFAAPPPSPAVLSSRPWTASKLRFLLHEAGEVIARREVGLLEALAGVFRTQVPLAAHLFSLYLLGRSEGRSREEGAAGRGLLAHLHRLAQDFREPGGEAEALGGLVVDLYDVVKLVQAEGGRRRGSED